MKMTEQMALLWSVNPKGNYSDKHHLVGSVLAHMAHIERYGAVYWDLVVDSNVEQFEHRYPMSGYLYCTDSKAIDYRVRILDISFGPREENLKYVPTWREYDDSEAYLFILLDQIDKIFPPRKYNEFIKIIDGKPVRRQPIGGYTRVVDPLF